MDLRTLPPLYVIYGLSASLLADAPEVPLPGVTANSTIIGLAGVMLAALVWVVKKQQDSFPISLKEQQTMFVDALKSQQETFSEALKEREKTFTATLDKLLEKMVTKSE